MPGTLTSPDIWFLSTALKLPNPAVVEPCKVFDTLTRLDSTIVSRVTRLLLLYSSPTHQNVLATIMMLSACVNCLLPEVGPITLLKAPRNKVVPAGVESDEGTQVSSPHVSLIMIHTL